MEAKKRLRKKSSTGGGRSPRSSEYDSLSGLLGRSGFNKAVRSALDDHPDVAYLLIYGDIDRFKVYNDLFGTKAGDRLLAAIGGMIQKAMPCDAVAGRLRADHFVCLYPRASFDADRVLATLDNWFDSYREDFTFFVRLGIFTIDDPDMDVSLMCDRALLALKAAKSVKAGSKYAFYEEDLREGVLREQELAGEMAAAIEQRQIVPFFQPQYNYTTHALVGAEVLARWDHPVKGLLSPAEFIPVFERNGLIADFDRAMWESACRCLRTWIDQRGIENVPRLSVNLSRADIYQPDLCEALSGLVERYRIPTDLLHLEITETAYMDAPEQLVEVVTCLRTSGFVVEMDDFGSGYSSLNTLKDVPVDVLKLDMGFLDARGSSRGGLILASVVRMARWLDLPVIAEGVETREQAEFLASIGCDYMQGYLFSRPMDQDSFERMLDEGTLSPVEKPLLEKTQDNVMDFWAADSLYAFLFSNYVGPASLAEYDGRRLEVVRMNKEFGALFDLLGHDAASASLRKDLLPRLFEEDRPALIEALDRLESGAGEAECEIRFRGEGDHRRWARLRIKLLTRTDNACGLYMLAEEITEQRALREAQERLHNALPCGVSLTKADRNNPVVLSANKYAYELMGFKSLEELLAQSGNLATATICDDDAPQYREHLNRLLDGEPTVDFTYRMKRGDGSVVWIEGTSALAEGVNGEPIIQSAFTDITDRIRESHERDLDRFSTVLCTAYQEIFELDMANGHYRLLFSDSHGAEGTVIPIEKALDFWYERMPEAEDRAALRQAIEECRAGDGKKPLSCTYKLIGTGGRTTWCQTTFLRVSGESVLCCNKDVTARLSDEDRKMFQRITETMGRLPVGVGVYAVQSDEVFPTYVNDRMCSLFGFSAEEYAQRIEQRLPVASQQEVARCMERIDHDSAFTEGIDVELKVKRKDGTPFDARLRGRAVRENEGVLVYAVMTDITDEVRERRERVWQNERYRLLSEMTGSISFDYDSEDDTVMLYLDRTGEGVEEQVIPHYLETLSAARTGVVHPDSIEDVRQMFESARAGAVQVGTEYRADYYGDGYAWYRANLFVVHDEAGAWHLVGLIENIDHERDLRFRAEYDATTGLSNHAATKDLITAALTDSLVRSHSVCAVLDIDNFKDVNDSLGHIEGDALLHAVGDILRTSFRESDIVGRVGGDEFVLLLKDIDADVALRKLERVRAQIADVRLGDGRIATSISVGVYATRPTDHAYRDAFVKADEALYQAKRSGKNRICLYGEH